MLLSRFPNTICGRDYFYSILCFCALCQILIDHWLGFISGLSILFHWSLSEDSSFPFHRMSFLCLIICETLLVCLCFLNWSVLTPWVCGVNFYGRRPVRFSGAISLISWAWRSWDALYAIYVGSLDIIVFWLLLGHSVLDTSLWLVDWRPLCPPCLVCCCAYPARTKPQRPGNKPTSAEITHPCNPTINSKRISINVGVKWVRLL